MVMVLTVLVGVVDSLCSGGKTGMFPFKTIHDSIYKNVASLSILREFTATQSELLDIIRRSYLGDLILILIFLGDTECKDVIMAAWPILNQPDTTTTFEAMLAACASDLAIWSKHEYGYVPIHLQKVMKEIKLANNGNRSVVNMAKIRRLEKERDRLSFLDEEFWRLRFGAEWLKGGDRNTKFFHAKANQR
ncbi:hypothetical protein PanWU01x14_039530 [Parasponia andersonii]|uniref:Uncharacterized protein n=1 Tax=Parasponia andersonii TaxID=3476 RepID=A0A2P5DQX1_PARAD|nr:hypothetical protein PanWU01x14_039530 [Parasponia andersonii]